MCLMWPGRVAWSIVSKAERSNEIRAKSAFFDDDLLEVPRTRCKTFGDRIFGAMAPRLWNSIPAKLQAQN